MPALLVVAFVAVPIVETYFLIQVGQTIGVLPTIALLVGISVAGAAARGMRRRTSSYGDVVEGEVVERPGHAEGPPPSGRRPLNGGES